MDDDGIRCSRCEQVLPPDTFAPSHRRNGYWCRPCRKQYMVEYAAAKPMAPCKDCGVVYERWHQYKRPGSAGVRCHDCYNAYQAKRMRAKAEPKPKRELVTHGKKPSGPRWRRMQEQVWLEETHCAFCGELVDQSLHHQDKMARSVDHKVPISMGGAMYERDNLRMAHRQCNVMAGTKTVIINERVALVRAALWLGANL